MSKKKAPYKIKLTTLPPRDRIVTQEEFDATLSKAISIVVDDLILNGHIRLDECIVKKDTEPSQIK